MNSFSPAADQQYKGVQGNDLMIFVIFAQIECGKLFKNLLIIN